MKESIAQAFILDLILFFFGLLVLLLFGSINYSKAYKVKNRIITIIEKYGTFDATNNDLMNEIHENLKNAGYSVEKQGENKYCKDRNTTDSKLLYPTTAGGYSGRSHYNFCVFERGQANSKYYQVIAFMKFDIPVIGGFLEFPVRGETKAIYSLN